MTDNDTREQPSVGTGLVASATVDERRHPDRRYDERGIVVGPWSDSVKRTNALLRSVRRTRS